MIGSMHAALAVSVGYLLGSRRTRRIATVLAAGAAAGCLGGAALRRGLTMPGPAAEPGDLTGTGTAAATAVARNRIGSLTGPPHERAGLVRDPGAAVTRPGRAGASGTAWNAQRRDRTAAGGASARGPQAGQALDQDGGASYWAGPSVRTPHDQQGG